MIKAYANGSGGASGNQLDQQAGGNLPGFGRS